jgi:hypothetical protein
MAMFHHGENGSCLKIFVSIQKGWEGSSHISFTM